MPLYFIALLAIIQGITEFLPISSTAHLVLLHHWYDPNAAEHAHQNRMLDIAVHVGTLLAVCLYFYKDVWGMICGTWDLLRRKSFDESENAQMMVYVLVGSVPMLVVGFAVYFFMDPAWFYNPYIIIFTTIVFGLLLGYADKIGATTRKVEDIVLKDALWVGCLQCLSIIPGVSRSGITMTAGRFLGLSRVEAARYSLLLAIVATSAVGAAGLFDLIQEGNVQLTNDFFLAAFLSFLTAIAVIALMMKWLAKFSFMPFVWYRMILGLALIGYFYIWPHL
jgi:undecaprenyl-diphosphatase